MSDERGRHRLQALSDIAGSSGVPTAGERGRETAVAEGHRRRAPAPRTAEGSLREAWSEGPRRWPPVECSADEGPLPEPYLTRLP